jgi:REP element-mobilizing transposase RayT
MDSRLPRYPPRLDFVHPEVTPLYLVSFNTHQRKPLLANSETHETFRRFCERAHTDFNVAVGRYVLMPDHVHIFVWLPQSEVTLSRWVQSLRNVLGKTLLTLGHSKPHWQRGFFDHLLRSSESYLQKWDYVSNNPVRAGLSARPEDWPFGGEIVRLHL